jgi:hypothetical protein
LREDASELGDPRCLGFNVAGTSHRRDALQEPGFSVLRPVLLRPEPGNAHDANAVGIWDTSGIHKIDFVPRRLSAAVAERFRAGRPLGAVITSEYRLGTRAGKRVGVQVVAAPVGTIELNVLSDVDARGRTTFASSIAVSASDIFGDGLLSRPVASSHAVPRLEVADPFGAIEAALQILIAEGSRAEYVIVQIKGSTNYYVQFAKSGPDQVHAEAVGQEHLTESEQLSAHQLAAIAAIGWQRPSASTDGNHWMVSDMAEAGAIERLVRMSLDTLFGVYRAQAALLIMSALPDHEVREAAEQLAPGCFVAPDPSRA